MRNLKFWFPLLGYSGIIFFISSVPSSQIKPPVDVWDKFLHMLEYAPLGVLAARLGANIYRVRGLALWATAAAFCYMYGLTDEFHQSFTPGREASIWDACADLVGSALGAGIYLIFQQGFIRRGIGSHVSTQSL